MVLLAESSGHGAAIELLVIVAILAAVVVALMLLELQLHRQPAQAVGVHRSRGPAWSPFFGTGSRISDGTPQAGGVSDSTRTL